MATINGVGGVAADTRKYSPRRFVFQPGGTREGNIYTDFAELYADLTAAGAGSTLVFDDSLVSPCVVPAGVYDMNGVVWEGHRATHGGSFLGTMAQVTFGAGVVSISNLNEIRNIWFIQTASYTGPPLQYSGSDQWLRLEYVWLFAGAGGYDALIGIGASTALAIDMRLSFLDSSSDPVFLVQAGGTLTAALYASGLEGPVSGVGGTFTVRYDANSSTGLTYGGSLGETLIDEANSIRFFPNSNEGLYSTNVQDVIDTDIPNRLSLWDRALLHSNQLETTTTQTLVKQAFVFYMQGATEPLDGDTLTLTDGTTTETFEFDNNASVGGGNFTVTMVAGIANQHIALQDSINANSTKWSAIHIPGSESGGTYASTFTGGVLVIYVTTQSGEGTTRDMRAYGTFAAASPRAVSFRTKWDYRSGDIETLPTTDPGLGGAHGGFNNSIGQNGAVVATMLDQNVYQAKVGSSGVGNFEWKQVNGGGGGDLAATLVLGNITGGTNIEVTSGDIIQGEDAAVASGLPGSNLLMRPGLGDGAGIDGSTVIGPGHTVGTSQNAFVAGGVHTLADASYAAVLGRNNTFTGTGHDYSFMAGRNNTINGTGFNPYITISGGSGHFIGDYAYGATIGGGLGNAIYSNGGSYASNAFLVGRYNRIYTNGYSPAYNSVLMGSGNRLYGGQSSFLVGLQNRIVNASYSLSGGNGSDVYGFGSIGFGGNAFVASRASYSAVFGRDAVSANIGGLVWGSSSRFLNGTVVTNGGRGAAQPASYGLGVTTQNATPQQMTTNGNTVVSAANRFILQADKVYTFRAIVSAYQTGGAAGTPGTTAGWIIEGMIKRVGAATSLVASSGTGTPTFFDAAASGWNVAVIADNVNEALVFTVTGEANKNIVWAARLDVSESGDPVLP